MEDAAAEGGCCEHAFDEGFEFDVAVVEAVWDGAGQLDLVGLEPVGKLILAKWWYGMPNREGHTSISPLCRLRLALSCQRDGQPWD